MIRAPEEDPPYGQWALHTAEVNLEAGTLSNNVEWQDPDGQQAFYEAYGWIPHSNRLIFMSTTRATSTGMGRSASSGRSRTNSTPPPRRPASRPPFAPVWPWQSAVDVFHEFAHFAPGDPNTLYTSIGADTVGGDDLFSYDLRTQQPSGLLGQPHRISYFGGDLNANWGSGGDTRLADSRLHGRDHDGVGERRLDDHHLPRHPLRTRERLADPGTPDRTRLTGLGRIGRRSQAPRPQAPPPAAPVDGGPRPVCERSAIARAQARPRRAWATRTRHAPRRPQPGGAHSRPPARGIPAPAAARWRTPAARHALSAAPQTSRHRARRRAHHKAS